MYPIYSNFSINIKTKIDNNSSFDFDKSSFPSTIPIGWQLPISSTPKESFIGMLTDNEASEMREEISLFKKRFNDDFDKRNKIMFGV